MEARSKGWEAYRHPKPLLRQLNEHIKTQMRAVSTNDGGFEISYFINEALVCRATFMRIYIIGERRYFLSQQHCSQNEVD